jgi:hypothetical protein
MDALAERADLSRYFTDDVVVTRPARGGELEDHLYGEPAAQLPLLAGNMTENLADARGTAIISATRSRHAA